MAAHARGTSSEANEAEASGIVLLDPSTPPQRDVEKETMAAHARETPTEAEASEPVPDPSFQIDVEQETMAAHARQTPAEANKAKASELVPHPSPQPHVEKETMAAHARETSAEGKEAEASAIVLPDPSTPPQRDVEKETMAAHARETSAEGKEAEASKPAHPQAHGDNQQMTVVKISRDILELMIGMSVWLFPWQPKKGSLDQKFCFVETGSNTAVATAVLKQVTAIDNFADLRSSKAFHSSTQAQKNAWRTRALASLHAVRIWHAM